MLEIGSFNVPVPSMANGMDLLHGFTCIMLEKYYLCIIYALISMYQDLQSDLVWHMHAVFPFLLYCKVLILLMVQLADDMVHINAFVKVLLDLCRLENVSEFFIFLVAILLLTA